MKNIERNSKQLNEKLKQEFIDLLKQIHRPNANIDGLISKLEASDFFRAPASTRYHNSYIGGLCEHSLNVYHNLKQLVDIKGLTDIDPDSIIICALLHDMSKMNQYELYIRNEKVYREDGSKHDALGNFEWESSYGFKTRDAKERFIYGNHEETSEFMVKSYIPLTVEESVAILTHHAGMGYDSVPSEVLSDRFNNYKLSTLLHVADFMAAYIDENIYE